MESSKNNLGMEARVGSKYSLGAEEAVSESIGFIVGGVEEWIGYMRGGY